MVHGMKYKLVSWYTVKTNTIRPDYVITVGIGGFFGLFCKPCTYRGSLSKIWRNYETGKKEWGINYELDDWVVLIEWGQLQHLKIEEPAQT